VALVVLGFAVYYLTLPNGTEYRHRWPERTAYMQLRIDQARQAGHELDIRYRPVPLSKIPRSVRRAVLVGEDAGFHGHGAFDWGEIRAAVEQAWREKRAPRGASTITQQLARNLYLSPHRSWWRKGREALIAVRIEHALSKNRILELYLNVIELGPGVFGVGAAAVYYFGEPVDDLGPEEAVRIAATIPSPLNDNPDTNTRAYRWRIGLIGSRAFRPDTSGETVADSLAPGEIQSGARPPPLPSLDTVARPPNADSVSPDTARVHPDADGRTAHASSGRASSGWWRKIRRPTPRPGWRGSAEPPAVANAETVDGVAAGSAEPRARTAAAG